MNDRTVVYKGGYVVLPNAAANDVRLSFRARGLLAYMLGRPPGWSFSADRLYKEAPEGRDAIRSALRELTRAGYYRTQKLRTAGGKFFTVTEVAELPSLLPPPADPLLPFDPTEDGFPAAGLPTSGGPTSGEAALYVMPENHSRDSSDDGEVK